MTNAKGSAMTPARRSGCAWATLLLIALSGLALDLWSKSWAFAHVAPEPVVLERETLLNRPEASYLPPDRMEVLPWGLLDFQLMLNSGAVFGLGAGQRWLLVAFSLLAIGVAVWIFGWRTSAASRMAHVGIALVIAGAVGNLWDRIIYARVRDFLFMLPDWNLPFGLTWPGGRPEMWPWIFNIADVLLLTGLGLIMLHMMKADRAAARAKEQGRSQFPASND
ncbi:MAG: signal peptidase II [Phycisphaerales bacterium]|nr:signal peptidase II [Phycisphaerales bacterium]